MGNPNRRGGGGRKSIPTSDSDEPATRTTFYVTNISDRVTGLKLKEAFRPFVHMTDAWVPRRKSIKGKVFGFVRCQKIKDPYQVLESLNEISIMESRITVSLAMFDRSHRKISYVTDEAVKKAWLPKKKNIMEDEFPVLKSAYCGPPRSKKTLVVEDVGSAHPIHCMGRAVIGTAESIGHLHSVKKIVSTAGFHEAAVSYLGGLSVLISFRNEEEMQDFIISKENIWKEALSSVSPWIGQAIPFERIVMLKVVGMPVQLRDKVLFDKVGSLFGKVVWPSDFSWSGVDNSVGFTHVLTTLSSRIDEEVSIWWKGVGSNVWVVEEQYTWIPGFEKVRAEDVVEDMEEGEIRDEVPENGAGDSAGEEDVTKSKGVKTS